MKVAGRVLQALQKPPIRPKVIILHSLLTLLLPEQLTLHFNFSKIVLFMTVFIQRIDFFFFNFDKAALEKDLEMLALACYLKYCFQKLTVAFLGP